MWHVVVVGGGPAGCWAGAAASAAGARVTVVRRSLGAGAMSSGALDAVPPADAADAEAWLSRLDRDHPGHPYLAEGRPPSLTELDAELSALGLGLAASGLRLRVDLADPVLVAASTGQVRHAGAVPQTVAAGDLRGRTAVTVVGIDGLRTVDAAAVAAGIAERVPWVRARAARVSPGVSGPGPTDLDAATVARAVEAPGGAEDLGRRIATALDGGARTGELVLLAPVLGLGDATPVAARVAAAAGVPVAELLAAPPSAPGWRLAAAAWGLAARSGADTMTGAVVALRTQGTRVLAAVMADGSEIACDAVVLAGGRFLGGGLTLTGRPREPLLDLPVFVGGAEVGELSRGDLVERTRFIDQPVLAAGLRVDSRWRPVDRFGARRFDNVVACGALLAGVDTTLGQGGLGVVVWTAGRAGRSAAALALAAAG